jgi:ABC-2 type transport system permease protein
VIGLAKSFTRIFSYVGKELVQVVRRPGAFISLVLGPFLIMAIFGAGYSGVRRPLETVLAIPASSGLPRDAEYYGDTFGPAFHVAAIVETPEEAVARLQDQQIDLILSAPPDPEEVLRSGEPVTIEVIYSQIDPTGEAYIRFLTDRLVREINRTILTTAVSTGERYLIERIGEDPIAIDPDVVASPTEAVPTNLVDPTPTIVQFFSPAVLALIIQHIAVTLSALSLVRERLSGIMELFRISPVSSFEIMLGKYLGFGLIAGAITAITVALMVALLGVPVQGDPWFFTGVIALLLFASIGLGLLISVISDSERQAVQLALLVLLASVFFSGFVLPVAEFVPEVRTGAYLLPVTHGIALLQDVMLRGSTHAQWQVGALALIGLFLFVLTSLLLRRSMRRA